MHGHAATKPAKEHLVARAHAADEALRTRLPAIGTTLRRPSRPLLRFFEIYLSLYVPFHFNALRLAWPQRFPRLARPLIVCINHPSWWDPLTSILIARFLLREADNYAPIDALSLPRHRILGGLGLFPVEQGTARGAVQFLRAAQSILADANAVLWLTPQGSFSDVRTRPVVLKAGLSALIKRMDHVTVATLAYEYTYWDERRPEILACCGEPLSFTRGQLDGSQSTNLVDPGEHVASALARTQDELAALSLARDAHQFVTVMAGNTGVGTLRAMCRNVLASLRASQYQGASSEHRRVGQQ